MTPVQATIHGSENAVEKFESAYKAYQRNKRTFSVVLLAALGLSFVLSIISTEFDLFTLINGFPRTREFLFRLVPPITYDEFTLDVLDWYWNIEKWLENLLNTLLMAFLATFLGTLIGGALSFFAARNLVKHYATYWITRRILEIARTVPDIVWALIFVITFGVGPQAGVLAILIHTVGAQGKLFAEVNENISHHPVEGVRATGGNWVQEIRFAVLPQVLPNFMSYTFWRIELNVRSATIVGFVGAGGIGQDLFIAIQLLEFPDAGAILLIVVATIMLIDMASEKLRHYLVGKEALER
ncbi:MAG: phosphonate ABC transporter, permease protein PhnE [Gammaproteobacteria bacterium]|nr:MAG: phosphonate ABC transporter, permease protein PhnE [Gammaproteobacteria bacterium]